jgi:beta-lactamase regulating signal transducer with metallopeptidase domain
MNIIEYLNSPVCTRLVLALAHFLWQGLGMALFVTVASSVLGRNSSRIRYGICTIGLFAMVLSLVITYALIDVPIGQPVAESGPVPEAASMEGQPSAVVPLITSREPSEAVEPALVEPVSAAQTAPKPADSRAPQFSLNWRRCVPYVVSLYFAGVLVMIGRLLIGLQGGQRLRKFSIPVDDETILAALSRQARVIGLAFTPAVSFCKRVIVPTVVGILKPTILLPVSFAADLSLQQIEMLLAHELAHIRRYDPLVNIIQRVIEAVLFFHPAVWFVSGKIRVERENCCDDLVLEAGVKAADYASSLVEIAQRGLLRTSKRRPIAEGVSSAGKPSRLGERIRRMIGIPRCPQVRLTRPGTIGTLLVLAVAISTMVALSSNADVEVKVEESNSAVGVGEQRYEGRTIEEWISEWDSEEYDDIREATEALVRIGRPVVPVLLEEIRKRSNHGWRAVGVLAKMGPEAEDAIAVLIEAALDKDLRFGDGQQAPEAYRGSVLHYLSLMTWASDRLIPVLRSIAEDGEEDTRVRAGAIRAIGNFGKEVLPILEKLAEAQDRGVRDAARGALGDLLEKEEGLDKKDYYARLVEKDPFDASVPRYLGTMKGIINFGRPHPLTQKVKQLYRERLAKEPDAQLAWQLATIIQNGLGSTELDWAAPTDSSRGHWLREDPAESFVTLAEVLELGFGHAEANSELQLKSGIALAKLRLLQGDWAGMNKMLKALGQEPIPEESRPWLPAPPVSWEENLSSQWQIADESMRSGNCSLEFLIEKDGKGLKGVHFLVKRAPEPTNVYVSGWRADTLFHAPNPLGDSRFSFGYMGNDRAMTRYGVSDESGVVRFDGLPNIEIKIEVLVPTANFEEVGSDWDLWMEVAPGKFKIAKVYGGAEAVDFRKGVAVVELKEGKTVHYPKLVVRPALGLNVRDWDSVDKDSFVLGWQGLDPSHIEKGLQYELEMFLSAPDMAHNSIDRAPVIESAKQVMKENQWAVGAKGVGGLRLGPGNIYVFEVRAVDESGTVAARWPRTRVWIPWGYRESDPPFTSRPYRSGDDRYDSPPSYQGLYEGSWWVVEFEYSDGRKETLGEKVRRFVRDYPNIFEYEYVRVRKAWVDWHNGDDDAARQELERLTKELPGGSLVRGTAASLLQQMDEGKGPSKRLNFVVDQDTSGS